jgi:hypothetical protein
MSQPWYDPSSKWMLEERGASVLYVAGAPSVVSCKARKAEVVQPRKLPDGLLDARFAGSNETRLVLVEVATYPEERVVRQIQDDLRLVRQARGALVDAVVLCLCPRGSYRVPESLQETSPLGWSGESLRWKVVELWTLPAEHLLAASDVGVVLWATLAKYDGSPEVLLRRCRDRIDREGGDQRANLLAVAQVFARLHFDRPEWLDILGGSKAMIESPFIQGIVEESGRTGKVQLIVHILQDKFGPVGPAISAGLGEVKDNDKLMALGAWAARCNSLQDFDDRLRAELPKPRPASTRGKRRTRKPGE